MNRHRTRCCFVIALALAACDERSPAVAKSESAAAVTPLNESATVVAPQPLTADGWGPLRIGMTLEQVVAASGADANAQLVGGPDPATCDEFRPARAPAGLLVMIQQGRLTRISLGAGSALTTDKGFGIGANASTITSSYGTRAVTSPHKYSPSPAAYITVWTIAPPDTAARGVVYELGSEGRVARIHAGDASIKYVEGCL